MSLPRGLFEPSQLVADRYRVIELIGGGEYTEVYKVQDIVENKTLNFKVARDPKEGESILKKEFYYLSKFSHPGIVAVYDYGVTPDRHPYFTMEFVPGVPINNYFQGYNPKLIEVFIQVLNALDTIHAQGLLHSDLKPQHILIFEEDGRLRAKLLDFGFAERLRVSESISAKGTLGYIAPEVFKGVDVDTRADLYSLGVVLYEILTGVGPGEGQELYDWLRRQYYGELPSPRSLNPNIPLEIERVVLQLLNREPERRPFSARAVIQLLTKTTPEVAIAPMMRQDLMAPGFIGRQECLNLLRQRLHLALEEKPGVVCISGDRGVGKSRLLAEFKFLAQLEGATVFSFEPVSLSARSQSVIERLITILRVYGSDIALPLELSVESKFRVFEAVTQALKKFVDSPRVRKSLILIVDDFETFDLLSVEFLRYLAFSLEKERLLVVVSGLKEKRFIDLVEELTQKPFCHHLAIPPLEREEVKNLIASLLGDVSEIDVLTDWIFNFTGGNPLWTIETVHELIERKVLVREDFHWRTILETLPSVSPPKTVIDVVRHRLEILTPDELAVLEVGATANGPFTSEFLRTVLNFDDRVLNNAVSRLKALGFLRLFRSYDEESGIFLDSYILSSKILEAAVIERLNINQRRELHRRIALAIELLYPERLKERVFDLAHHWTQAGVNDRAYRYSLGAGAKSREWLLFDKALSFYENAFTLSADLVPIKERLQLMETVGELRAAVGQFQSAIDIFEEGIRTVIGDSELAGDKKLLSRFYRRLGLVESQRGDNRAALNFLNRALLLEPDREGLEFARLQADLGWSLCAVGELNQAEEVLTQAMKLAQKHKSISPLPATRLLGLIFYYFSVIAYSRGDFVLAQQLALKSVKVYESVQDEIMVARLKHFLANIYYAQSANLSEAKRFYQEALIIQHRAGDVYSQLQTLHGLGIVSQESGEWNNAYEQFSEALRLAERIGDLASQTRINMMLGSVAHIKGDWEKAESFLEEARKIQDRAGERVEFATRVSVLLNSAKLKTDQGNLELAELYLKEAQELLHETKDLDLSYHLLVTSSEFWLRKKEFEKVRNCLIRAFNIVRVKKNHSKLAQLYNLACQLRIATGGYQRAKYDANCALNLLKESTFHREFPVALRLSGVVNCYLGEGEKGKEQIKKSIQILRNIGAKYELGLSLLADAQAFFNQEKRARRLEEPVSREELQEVKANLEEALGIFKELNAKIEIVTTEHLLTELKRTFGMVEIKARERGEYLKVFYEVGELLKLSLDKEDFFNRILELLLSVTRAERGLFFLIQDNRLFPIAVRGAESTTIADAEAVSHSVLSKVRQQGEPIISVDAISDPEFNSFNSVILNKIRSLLCVPLVVREQVLGTIYLDSRVTPHLWSEDDKNLLIAVANFLASVIERSPAYQMIQEEVASEKMAPEYEEEVFVGRSKAMRNVCEVINKIAPYDCTVLLTGETGTGKGVLARLIHQRSPRRENRFVTVNCGTLPDTLFESELFGHTRGSFTGAVKDKIGIFETANGGTIFLDEITNTTPAIQAKLLQVLEEKIIRRVGETEPRTVDVRLVCSTNKDLKKEVELGRFREDLFYRINVATINVPPLRERASDIPSLASYFLYRICKRLKKTVLGFEDTVLTAFTKYHWPGNVRELQNTVERAVIMTDKRIISLEDVGKPFINLVRSANRRQASKNDVINALKETGGNITRAAGLLSTNRRQVQRLIKKYQIDLNHLDDKG